MFEVSLTLDRRKLGFEEDLFDKQVFRCDSGDSLLIELEFQVLRRRRQAHMFGTIGPSTHHDNTVHIFLIWESKL